VAGGNGPWYVVTNAVLDLSGPAQRTYAIEVLP
jgi:hypothetical protein